MTLKEKRLQWILTETPYSYAQKGLLCALLEYLNTHQECWPTNSTLALKGRVSERTVSSYIGLFEDDGLVTITYGERPRGKSSGRILHFHFPGEEPSSPDPKPTQTRGAGKRTKRSGKKPGEQEMVSGKEVNQYRSFSGKAGNGCRSTGETVSRGTRKSFPAEEVLESKDPETRKNQVQGSFSGARQGEKQRERSAVQEPCPGEKEGLSREQGDPVCEMILEIYGRVCAAMKPAEDFPETGREALKDLLAVYPEARSRAWWEAYFKRAAASKMLTGGGKRGRRGTLGLLLVPWMVRRVLDGDYDDTLELCG